MADSESSDPVRVFSAGSRYLQGNESCIADAATKCDGNDTSSAVMPRLVVPFGGSLIYHNLDVFPHDLRSQDVDERGRPLFAASRSVGIDIVIDLSNLKPGKYPFYCTYHVPRPDGSGMAGLLEVAPS